MILKKRDVRIVEIKQLFDLMTHPEVFPFVRQKVYSVEELLFLTKQTIEKEEHRECISRTILDEHGVAIGTINLFDIEDNAGFLGTWIGKEFHGKGYNRIAKEHFFDELFLEQGIERIYMKVRKTNIRSLKAVQKLPYAFCVNESHIDLWQQINKGSVTFDLFEIPKAAYVAHLNLQEMITGTINPINHKLLEA